MKKILYVLALAWLVCGVASCEKEVKDYDGREGVYFYVQYGGILLFGRASLLPR